MLLGKGANRGDLDSVESMIAKLKGRPDYQAVTADAREAFARDKLTLPESVYTRVGTTEWFRQLSEKLK